MKPGGAAPPAFCMARREDAGMENESRRLSISFNAPVILIFMLICVVAQALNHLTGGTTNRLIFSVYRSSLTSPMTYVRCVCHIFGHMDWEHLINNMMYLLLLGPMLEEKYGSANIVFIMLTTAIVTAVVNMAFFPNVMLMGASGVVFAMILLSSITSTDEGAIPITFIIVALLYLGKQVYQGIFVEDNVSQLGHIIGGVVGSVTGFAMNRLKMNRYKR